MGTVTLFSMVAVAADLLGGWFTLRFRQLQGEMEQVMALGAGFLLGSALLSMLPTALRAPGGALTVAAGFAAFLGLRALVGRMQRPGTSLGIESAWAVVGGMLFHSLLEGVALGLAVQAGSTMGLLALLAIALHKLPEGFAVATVVFSATGSTRSAWLAVLAIGTATLLGGWAALLFAGLAALPHGGLLGLAAGSFLFVGATEMLPQVLRRQGSVWLVWAGMGLVYLLVGSPAHQH